MVGGVRHPTTDAAALADVSTLGPVFAVATDPTEGLDPSWRPLADLLRDPDLLRARVDAARVALGTPEQPVEARVAASLVFGGLAARLVAPVLAVAVLHGRVPGLDLETLHWRPWTVGVVPLRATGARGRPADPGSVPAAVVGPSLALADALRERTRVSRRLLHGEIAVAVAKVARILARDRPAAAGTALALASDLLGRAPLAGTAELLATGDGPVLRRRTCCLAYRVPGGRTCADCVLTVTPSGTDVITD